MNKEVGFNYVTWEENQIFKGRKRLQIPCGMISLKHCLFEPKFKRKKGVIQTVEWQHQGQKNPELWNG